jgi:hypothetical protein
MATGELPPGGYGSSPPGGMGITTQGFGQEGYVLEERPAALPKPAPEELSFATGVPYYLPFATPYRDSWEVFREDPVSIRQLIAMRRQDGQARALYRLLTRPILAALKGADVIPVDGQVGGKTEAQFGKDMLLQPPSMGGMEFPFSRFIKQMLLALFNGFTAWEMLYWVPKTGPLKGKVTLRALDWRPAETLTFLLDGQGRFNGMRQRTFFQGRTIDVKIPRDVAVYYAHEEAERPFYGVSMFESAFYHYDKKTKLYYVAHLAAQRAAVGLRVGTMPPNPHRADKESFTRAMADLGLAQYIILPSPDWSVDTLQEAGSFDYLGLINHHNSQMSKSVLAEWFDNAQGGGDGDAAIVDFGKQSDVTFFLMLEGIMAEMEDVINHDILPRFIDWNFGSSKYPKFRFGQLSAEQKAAIQDTFDKLAAAGQSANVTPEFMLELEQRLSDSLGLDVDYDEIKRKREQQRAAMESQFAMGGGGFGGSPFGQQPPGQQQGQPPDEGGGAGSSVGWQGGGQGGVSPGLLPQGFQAVQAAARQAVEDVLLSGGPSE